MRGYLYVFFIVVVIATALGLETTAAPPVTTPPSPSPTTSTPTPKPTQPTTSPTTSATKPTTTTTKLTTASEIPTTASDVPTTTSAGPTPTTMAPPTQQINTFYDNSKGNDTVCIVVQMATNFSIAYNTTDGKTSSQGWEFPADSDVVQNCGSNTTTQTLTISSGNYKLEMKFSETDKDQKYNLTEMVLSYNTKDFIPKAKDPKPGSGTYNRSKFDTPIGNSYECNSQQNFNFSDNVKVTMQNVRVQAFMKKPTDKKIAFGDAVQCNADVKTNNIVPIAVGAALAALVVIVLVAYLISRNRNQGGYESV